MRGSILFVCLHGSAKSLIAAEYLNRLAGSRRLSIAGESAGVLPDSNVPTHVIDGLAADGIDVTGYTPGLATRERLAAAAKVVSFGCDVGVGLPPATPFERWDDVPLVSDGFTAARDAIVTRVEQLLDTLTIS